MTSIRKCEKYPVACSTRRELSGEPCACDECRMYAEELLQKYEVERAMTPETTSSMTGETR